MQILRRLRRHSPQTAPSGAEFYRIDYDVVLLFGLTELKAQISWMENGVEMRTPASIAYVED